MNMGPSFHNLHACPHPYITPPKGGEGGNPIKHGRSAASQLQQKNTKKTIYQQIYTRYIVCVPKPEKRPIVVPIGWRCGRRLGHRM